MGMSPMNSDFFQWPFHRSKREGTIKNRRRLHSSETVYTKGSGDQQAMDSLLPVIRSQQIKTRLQPYDVGMDQRIKLHYPSKMRCLKTWRPRIFLAMSDWLPHVDQPLAPGSMIPVTYSSHGYGSRFFSTKPLKICRNATRLGTNVPMGYSPVIWLAGPSP